ncbi:hypothetical protein CWE12_08685 [Aliidiomarina sedimenti]|uniref:Lipoprotein n=1 Tax=Aliidiomarina sedimenti TaxID=1933879 RepID=A0ABY0BZT6_9GAMM|nr:hypothetical protein [Aliidiomarina sedimenti]RUO30026.1 hypothetical protein CWE12_08685 [Aliidiomarina sedimenti]
MSKQSLLKPVLACVLAAVLTACTHSTSTSAAEQSTSFEPVSEAHGIQLSGVFEAPDEWRLNLATPLLQAPQAATENNPPGNHNEYWVRINDATERLPVAVSDISKGPMHFSVDVGHSHLPIQQLTLYRNQHQLQVIENDQPLPAAGQWLPMVKLASVPASEHGEQGQLCVTWPDQFFARAALLTVSDQGRLQLQQQSTSSPVCIDATDESHAQLRVNLRNPMFAVQLKTNR